MESNETAEGKETHDGRRQKLVQFVSTKGTPVSGRYRGKRERIAESVADLRLACEGAFSLCEQTDQRDRGQWLAALARACSVFLRKMVIGDRDDPGTRLLDDDVIRGSGIKLHKLRRISMPRRELEVEQTLERGAVVVQKLDEITGSPEATEILQMGRQTLKIVVEWPLPGAAGWTDVPTPEVPWTMAPEELFELGGTEMPDCDAWLGQQLVLFDRRGITLKDVIRMVATFEGAHSINVSRLLQPQDEQSRGPFRYRERHILDNVTVFGVKYTHMVVVETALYLYERLVDVGHVERPEKEWRMRASFVAAEGEGFFESAEWLGFAGGLILSLGGREQSISHRIRAVGK